MARTRYLKPDFFRDAKVVRCDPISRLLFQGLWCYADYTGRLRYDPDQLLLDLFPNQGRLPIDDHLSELKGAGLIDIYDHSQAGRIIHVVNFERHQHIHHGEKTDKGEPRPHLPAREQGEVVTGFRPK